MATPGIVPKHKVITAIKRGIKKAFDGYYFGSGDDYRWAVPESYIQMKIFDELSNIKPHQGFYVTLEYPYYDILEICNASPYMLKKYSAEKSQRADLVFWKGKGVPRYIIEVKRNTDTNLVSNDVEKIRDVLNVKSDLEGGFIVPVSYYKKANKKKFEARFERISNKTNTLVEDFIIGDYEEDSWGGAILFLNS